MKRFLFLAFAALSLTAAAQSSNNPSPLLQRPQILSGAVVPVSPERSIGSNIITSRTLTFSGTADSVGNYQETAYRTVYTDKTAELMNLSTGAKTTHTFAKRVQDYGNWQFVFVTSDDTLVMISRYGAVAVVTKQAATIYY